MDKRSLGYYIQSLREDLGLSQEELAVRAGVSRSTIQNVEAGRRNPRPASLRRIAHALDTDLAALRNSRTKPPLNQDTEAVPDEHFAAPTTTSTPQAADEALAEIRRVIDQFPQVAPSIARIAEEYARIFGEAERKAQ